MNARWQQAQMTAPKISHSARIIALISFILGTALFVSYYLTDASSLLFLGLGFIIVGGLINLIYFILLVQQIQKVKVNRERLYFTCGLMLVNIPILLLYCWWTLILLNTMRITFVNETSSRVTNIKIFGCEEKRIDKLDPGEKKLVWVNITGECAVNIEFSKDGKKEGENVLDYTTNNMGQRVTHKIGWENAPATY